MNRRDIIIIAVLINAGLLVVLFTSALKSDPSEPALVLQTEMQSSQPQAFQPQPAAAAQVKGDEVDRVLSQFAAVSSPTEQQSVAPAGSTNAPLLQSVAVSPPSPDAAASSAPTSFLEEAQSPIQGFNSDVNSAPTGGAKPSASTTASHKQVKVKKGDALEKIARAHRTSVQEIMRLNKLSSTQLKIGQVLKIPSKEGKQSFAGKGQTSDTHFYIVKNGDNPWTIAVKNQMKVEELLQLNGLDEEKARRLKPGDQLRIR